MNIIIEDISMVDFCKLTCKYIRKKKRWSRFKFLHRTIANIECFDANNLKALE